MTDKQRQLYKDRLDNLNTERKARLEILSQNRKDLQTQYARIRQTLEKVRDKNTPLPERILTLICEQIVTIILTLTSLLTGVATIALSIMGDFGGGGGTGGPLTKGDLEKMVRQVSRCTQKICRKGRRSIACYCKKCCWCNFRFPWKSRWIRC